MLLIPEPEPQPEPEPEPDGPTIVEEYAPRAAIYEALPSFMLRLTGLGPGRGRANSMGLESDTPRSSVWLRSSAGTGTYGADRSTVGAGYDFDRIRFEAGLNGAFGEHVDGWVSMRHVTGSADISSPTGGGGIEAKGLGPAAGIALGSTDGFYATGGFSLMLYDMDLSSDTRGLLKADTKGYVHTLDFQAGRGIGLGGNTTISPLGRVTHARVAIDDFTDAVDARVSFPDLHRVAGGLGMALETSHAWNDGAFFLRGSVEIERTFKGAATVAHVSGETLTSEAARDRGLLGLSTAWRNGRFSMGGEFSATGLGSRDREYSGHVTFGIAF